MISFDTCSILDFSMEYSCYAADITFTYPVNGKFTPEQRDIYNAVLKTRNTVLAATKPGKCKQIYQIHTSHNAPVLYTTVRHSEQKYAHFCSWQCIVRYVHGGICGISRFWLYNQYDQCNFSCLCCVIQNSTLKLGEKHGRWCQIFPILHAFIQFSK